MTNPQPESAKPSPLDGERDTQTRWLSAALGQPIKVRLLDGKVLAGTLTGFDTFTVLLEQPGQSSSILLFKQSLSYIIVDHGERGEP